MNANPPDLPEQPEQPEQPKLQEPPVLPPMPPYQGPPQHDSGQPAPNQQFQGQHQHPQPFPQAPPYPQQQVPHLSQAQHPQAQHPQAQYPQAQYPPIPPQWQPQTPPGGKIWLGILIGAGVPILGAILGAWASNASLYTLAGWLMMLPFWLMVIAGIVLTSIRSTRRTGIGTWIGLASIPIIGLGARVVMIFGSFSSY